MTTPSNETLMEIWEGKLSIREAGIAFGLQDWQIEKTSNFLARTSTDEAMRLHLFQRFKAYGELVAAGLLPADKIIPVGGNIDSVPNEGDVGVSSEGNFYFSKGSWQKI